MAINSSFLSRINAMRLGKPDRLPTWTVKDCFSHLIGIEARLLECPSPELEIKELRHVRNSQGLVNEIDVVSRRHKSNNELIEEFLEVTSKRRCKDRRFCCTQC